jgi:hypothetical protein
MAGSETKETAKLLCPLCTLHDYGAYFHLYAPTEAYFDRSWALPDIVRIT